MILLLSLILICTFLTLVLLNYPSYKRRKECLDKIPSPKGLPFGIGHALEIRTNIDTYEKFKKWTEELGSLYKLNLGPYVIYVTSDPILTELVLNGNFANKKAKFYYFARAWLGDGLVLSSGEKWTKHKRAIQATFHIKLLEQFIGTFNKHTSKLIQILDKEENKDCVEISRYTNLLALDIVCETIMGVDINSQENCEKDSAYVKAVRFLTQSILKRSFSVMGQTNFTYSLTKAFKEERQQLNVVQSFIDSIIKERRQELIKIRENELILSEEQPEECFKKRNALLDMLLLQSTFTDDEIKDEVNTFMQAGHDTTSQTLNFALYCLSNHPFIQQKAYEEVCSIFLQLSTNQCTYSDLNKLKYLENVIKETLRLYTTFPFIGRELTEDFQYEGNTLLKGCNIFLYFQGIHSDPNNFTNPNQFNPERWNNDEVFTNSFLPFSVGPRNCIGQKFAMLEMKCLLAKILFNYEILLSNPPKQPILANEVVLKSMNGIYVGLKKR